jgi:hypothetical protein
MPDPENSTATIGAVKKSAKAATAPKESVMYLGPPRPYGLPIFGKTVFSGGLPEFCAKHQDKPHFLACFASLKECGKALQDLRDPKSDLAKAVAKVSQETLNPSAGKE